MREILFRAKTVKNVHWIWGDLFHAGTEPSDGEFAISYWDDEDGWMNENVQPGTIGQFTGLTDKNGKRVFEGDILRVKEYKNLCWDLSKSREERDEMMRTFALDDLKGELDKEYISAVAIEEGTYCLSSNADYNDMYLSCLFGEMNGSLPIFDFEVIGNIHDDPKMVNQVVFEKPKR